MFEQTLLTQPAPARKTGALAFSFLAQSCVLGVLVVGPLVYTKAIPLAVPKIDLPLFIRPLPPEPPRPVTQSNATPPSGRPTPRTFQSIYVRRVPPGPIAENIVEEIPEINSDSVPRETLGIEIPGTMSLPGYVAAIPPAETAKPLAIIVPEPTKPAPVSSVVLASKLITRIVPQYPDLARRTRTSGVVRLLVVVGKEGRVQNVRMLEGHPFLREAAISAVRQWVYSPTYLNGQPIAVEASIDVNFNLN